MYCSRGWKLIATIAAKFPHRYRTLLALQEANSNPIEYSSTIHCSQIEYLCILYICIYIYSIYVYILVKGKIVYKGEDYVLMRNRLSIYTEEIDECLANYLYFALQQLYIGNIYYFFLIHFFHIFFFLFIHFQSNLESTVIYYKKRSYQSLALKYY